MTRQRGGGGLVLLAVLSLLAVVALPLSFIALQAVFPAIASGSLAAPFSPVLAILGAPALAGSMLNTIVLGLTVVGVSAVVAVPLGVVRGLFRLPLQGLWDVLMLVPFMIPPYIAALSWILTLQPRGYLQQLAGFHLQGFLFSFWGIVFVMTLTGLPVVYFAVSRTVGAIGGRLIEAARVAGASPWTSFLRIVLPLSAPGIAASLLLVFALTIEEYGTPAALGAKSGFEVLVTEIETRVSDWPIDLTGAAALSLILVCLSLAAFLVQFRLLARHSFETVAGRPAPSAQASLGRWAPAVLPAFALVVLLATVAPLAAILATAFSRTLSGGLSPANLGLDNFGAVLRSGAAGLTALGNSLLLGVGTAAITGLLGTLAAYVILRTRLRGRSLLDALTVLPNALPGVVVAVGLILAWNQPWLPVTPYNTPLILLLAYCCILLPYPVRYAGAAFRQIGDSVEMAARIAGAGRFTAFRRILVPLVAPSVLSAMLIVFSVASRELVASLLLAPAGMATVSTYIWKQFDQGSVTVGMAMSTVTIAISTLMALALATLIRRSTPP